MELNEIKIKEHLKDYFSEGNKEHAVSCIRKEIDLYVYNFPMLAYHKNPDICSEFYIYLVERLGDAVKNFPYGSDIKFKTWLNYVLRNQFLNFMKYRRKEEIKFVNIDENDPGISIELLENDDQDFTKLHNALNTLPDYEKTIILLYHMPEKLTGDDILLASKLFSLGISEVLALQERLIIARFRESDNLRKISSKIGKINNDSMKLKNRLFEIRHDLTEKGLSDKGELLLKIARYDSAEQALEGP